MGNKRHFAIGETRSLRSKLRSARWHLAQAVTDIEIGLSDFASRDTGLPMPPHDVGWLREAKDILRRDAKRIRDAAKAIEQWLT